jgi:hypothetical protein
MIINRNDCYLLLAEIQERGIDVDNYIDELLKNGEPTLEILKFINDHRQLDLAKFYEKLRKCYNNNKSQLYINIVREIENPNEVLTTLSAMLTQILLFSRGAEDRNMFLQHSRANEISEVLAKYFKEYDITNCIKLLRIIRADLKVLEGIKIRTKENN